MKTIFISANDTGAGKTYVTAALACDLLLRHKRVQVVKAVETGVTQQTPAAATDAGFVAAFAHRHAGAGACAGLSTHTLQTFSQPLAPVDAALADGAVFDFTALVDALRALPAGGADWRLVEGAGGLAVPLEAGPAPRDWGDYAQTIGADATLLVVADRLGAINQARLLAAYAAARGLPQAGLWLNGVDAAVPQAVRASNQGVLAAGLAALPLWGVLGHGERWPQEAAAPWLM